MLALVSRCSPRLMSLGPIRSSPAWQRLWSHPAAKHLSLLPGVLPVLTQVCGGSHIAISRVAKKSTLPHCTIGARSKVVMFWWHKG